MQIGIGLSLTGIGGPGLDTATSALIAAMSVRPNQTHTAAIDTAIRALKADGLWTLLDYLCGFGALHDAQAFRINWKNPATVGTAVNTPTFTADQGYAFDGSTNYIDTGFAPSSATAATATSAFLATYERTNVNSNTHSAGAESSSASRIMLGPRLSASVSRGSMMSTLTTGAASVTDSRGLTAFDRTGTTFVFLNRGTQYDTISPATTNGTLPTVNLWLGGENNAGVLSTPRACTLAGAAFGAHLTNAQHATLYTILQACLTTIGANV